MPQLANVPCAHPVFLKQDLPDRVAKKLSQLPRGELRTWMIERAKDLRNSDQALWEAIRTASPELQDG